MGSDVDGYPKLITRKPAFLRRDTRIVIEAEVRPRPCTTMMDSAPAGGGGEQPAKTHTSAQVTDTRSFLSTIVLIPSCVLTSTPTLE
jgi:hypothetical protein